MCFEPRRVLGALLLLALVFSGCRSLTGRPMGRWVDDQAVTAKVKARLAGLSATTLTRINVDTYDGVVYLSGPVDSEQTKLRAEAIARSVDGVDLVVPNLAVRGGNGAASPDTATARADRGVPHPLLRRVKALARIEGDPAVRPQGPYAGYDRRGELVATIYTVPMQELAQYGLPELRPAGRPIDHVSIYAVTSDPDVPEAYYHIVLWHLSRGETGEQR
jgi:hypothetical protein